jgi:anti-anti-sigma factor
MSAISNNHASDCLPLGADVIDESSCHTVNMETFPLADAVVIVADGAIDAVSAASFAAYTVRESVNAASLVLDLTRLEFFGIEGFSALNTVSAHCASEDIRWAVATSPAVARVLRICDPAHVMPTAETLAGAQSMVLPEQEGRLLQLIPKTP